MSVSRLERVDALLKRVIGEAVFRIMAGGAAQPCLITITGVACAKDLRNATVRVSVFGDEALQTRTLATMNHRAAEFARVVNREVRLKFTPRLRFELDRSLAKGDETLAILGRLETGARDAAPELPSGEGADA